MPVTKHSYDAAVSSIADLKEKRTDLSAICECFESIFKAQKEYCESFAPDYTKLDFSTCEKRHKEGKPFLTSSAITIPWDRFDDLADTICTITSKYARDKEADFEQSWHTLDKSGDNWHHTLLKGFLEDPSQLSDLAKQSTLEPDFLTFIAAQALTPYLEKYAEKLREYIDANVWLKGTCPVCGGEPLMGRLDNDTGKKYLQCYLCRTNWEFGRIECAFCDTKDQEKLRYFYDEEDTVHRVEVCDNCKSYLKIVDTRDMIDDVVLIVENLTTLHLDLVAKREGFKRDTNKLFGI